MSAREWTGGFAGIVVAMILSGLLSWSLALDDTASFTLGMVLGGVCTLVGVTLGGTR
jgi:hypothetical protein